MKIGAIFDWDGVIIDSRVQHEKSWERLAAEEKRVLPEGHFLRGFGMKNDRIIPEVLRWTTDPAEIERVARRKEEIYREIVKEDGISALPGVRALLEQLLDAGIPCVIGSSTERRNIEAVLDLIGLRSFFPKIVSADDATHGKPHPEIFLKAAEKIAIPPEESVVFEDTHVGIEAARAGGMKVVGVATTHPRKELQQADRVVARLDELTPADLQALVAAD
jgi:beta-phosphoglucomutase family hydrolase